MSDSDIIKNIGTTLERLLKDELKSDLDPDCNQDGTTKDYIKLIRSLKDIPNEEESVVYLFLYQVVENSYLKNEEPYSIDGTHLRQPPLVVDLFYLVIPHIKVQSHEQTILARVMQVFHDNSILNVVRKLQDAGEDIETSEEIRIIFNPMSLDDLSKFWTIFHDVDYILSVGYIVTPVRIDSTREVRVQRVTYR